MNIRNMTTAAKVWLFIVGFLVFIGAIAGTGIARGFSIRADIENRTDRVIKLLELATELHHVSDVLSARSHAVLLSEGGKLPQEFKASIDSANAKVEELFKQLDTYSTLERDRAHVSKVDASRRKVLALGEQAATLKTNGDAEGAAKLLQNEYAQALRGYLGAQQDMVADLRVRLAEFKDEGRVRGQGNTTFILSGLVIAVVTVLFGTKWLVSTIRSPLAKANSVAARIAAGDLSQDVTVDRTDEFGQLLSSLQTMQSSLARMVTEVRYSTENIAVASSEIAQGNGDLAHRTEQTSANLQATASSMEHLTGTVQHSTDNARQASQLATNASTVAQRGGEVVTEVVRTMQEIDSSSKKISDIISVIDGIAFQTNILALNAAVEAARAGEQGRGFAVVASEVRALAGRSAEAAREIKALIVQSVEKVELGTSYVTQAGSTMDEIVQSVRRVADVIGEITAAANEQNSGIASVNQSIGDLDQMTQQNAALVEESAAAAESLREQADRLKQAVSVFKVGATAHTTLALPHR